MNNKNIKMIKNDLHYTYRHFYMEISKFDCKKELSCFTTG